MWKLSDSQKLKSGLLLKTDWTVPKITQIYDPVCIHRDRPIEVKALALVSSCVITFDNVYPRSFVLKCLRNAESLDLNSRSSSFRFIGFCAKVKHTSLDVWYISSFMLGLLEVVSSHCYVPYSVCALGKYCWKTLRWTFLEIILWRCSWMSVEF